MYRIIDGEHEGHTGTEQSCRMKVINTESYPAGSYAEAEAHYELADDDSGTADSGTQPADSGADGSHPSEDVPPSDPTDSGTDDSSDDEPECPDCGSNRYGLVDDYQEHIPDRFHSYDYVCADCKEVYNR